jgi:hypothetical protein
MMTIGAIERNAALYHESGTTAAKHALYSFLMKAAPAALNALTLVPD